MVSPGAVRPRPTCRINLCDNKLLWRWRRRRRLSVVWRQMTGRDMFVEWSRRHPVVTVLLPPHTEAVPVDYRPRPPSARQRPPDCGDVAAAFLQHDPLPSSGDVAVSLPVVVVAHVPAASVSDTGTPLAQPR